MENSPYLLKSASKVLQTRQQVSFAGKNNSKSKVLHIHKVTYT